MNLSLLSRDELRMVYKATFGVPLKLRDWVPNPFKDLSQFLNRVQADDFPDRLTGCLDTEDFTEHGIVAHLIELLVSNPNATDLLETILETTSFEDHVSADPEGYDNLDTSDRIGDVLIHNHEDLFENPKATRIIERYINGAYTKDVPNLEKEDWKILSKNPGVIHILEKHLKKIDWSMLSANPAAMDLLRANPEKIDWTILSSNPSAMDLLRANPDKINWEYFSMNPHPDAVKMLKENPDRVNLYGLAQNPSPVAMMWLASNPTWLKDTTVWKSPESKRLTTWNYRHAWKNQSAWELLSRNPSAGFILLMNPDKINWSRLPYTSDPVLDDLVIEKYLENTKTAKRWYLDDHYDWTHSHPAVIDVLQERLAKMKPKERMCQVLILRNPAAFEEDTEEFEHRCEEWVQAILNEKKY